MNKEGVPEIYGQYGLQMLGDFGLCWLRLILHKFDLLLKKALFIFEPNIKLKIEFYKYELFEGFSWLIFQTLDTKRILYGTNLLF